MPAKAARLVRVMVTVPEEPSGRNMVVGFALMLKGATETFSLREWE